MAAQQVAEREEFGQAGVGGQLHDQLLQVGQVVDDELRGCQAGHLGGGQCHTEPLHLG